MTQNVRISARQNVTMTSSLPQYAAAHVSTSLHEKLERFLHLNLRNLGGRRLVFGVGIQDPEADDRGRLLVTNDAESLGLY